MLRSKDLYDRNHDSSPVRIRIHVCTLILGAYYAGFDITLLREAEASAPNDVQGRQPSSISSHHIQVLLVHSTTVKANRFDQWYMDVTQREFTKSSTTPHDQAICSRHIRNMTRKSTRLSGVGAHKRVASTSDLDPTAETKKQKVTPTKSKYFSEPEEEPEQTEDESQSETNDDASDFEDEIEESQVSEAEKEDDESDSDHVAVSKGRKGSSKSTPKASEVWRPGVKTGELENGMVIFQRKEQPFDWARLTLM